MVTRIITKRDEENARRLNAIWEAKKKNLGLTQTKAAAQLGFRHQSTVSQYLNCVIALNTDVVLKFAKLLEVDPARIDPEIRSLVVRDLQPSQREIPVQCRIELSDVGNTCVARTSTIEALSNPFVGDTPRGTKLIGIEVGTRAYQSAFGIPGDCTAYVLKDSEPEINDVVFVAQPEKVGFYRFNGRMQDELLLTDPLTGQTERARVDEVETIGCMVGFLMNGLEKKQKWELH